MNRGWSRQDDSKLAVERILEGAEKAFSELGVSKAGMSEIAGFAGCSRGTVYRYFPDRHELHAAYIDRVTQEISVAVHDSLDKDATPRAQVAAGILGAISEVRRRPGALAWFEAGHSGTTARMARASEMIDAIASAFVAEILEPKRRSRVDRAKARWLVRCIVSLLSNPAETKAEEKLIVEEFVVPGIFGAHNA